MATVATASRGAIGHRAAPSAWPLYALFGALPIWWALGAAYFVWPLITLPLLFSLLLRGNVRVPPRFGLWLLFLAWMLLAAVQVEGDLRLALFAYRASLYVSATLLFLYVFNASRERLPDGTILKAMGLFYAAVIVGGFVGVFLPHVSFSTPVESIVPSSFLADQTAYYFVHPALAENMDFLGYPVGRPKTLFAYTNQWGACAAVLTPLALGAVSQMRPGAARRGLVILLILSVVPIAVSLNRGLWLSLGLGLAYVAIRLGRHRNARALVAGVVAVTVAGLVVLMTPLGGLVEDRFTAQKNSNNTRLTIYQTTVEEIKESPVFGYGSPRRNQFDADQPSIGTQGQAFTVAFSYGIPALLLFVAWFGYSLFRSMPRGSPSRFWANAAIFVLLMELPYYNYMPATLHVAMVAAGLLWRDVVEPPERPVRRPVLAATPAVGTPLTIEQARS
jgi:polysaccharide biosynthesis protein PslJ